MFDVHWELSKGEDADHLRCVAKPVAVLLAAFLSDDDSNRLDVVLLDSAQGLTTDPECTLFSPTGSWPYIMPGAAIPVDHDRDGGTLIETGVGSHRGPRDKNHIFELDLFKLDLGRHNPHP